MEIPALPTDNAHKFLAVGSLFIGIACLVGAFQLQQAALKYQSNWAARILDNPNAVRTLERDYSYPAALPKTEAEIPQPFRHLIDAKWGAPEDQTLFADALWINGAAFEVMFLVCMFFWFRHQHLDDALAILELRERAKRAGLELNVQLPKRFHCPNGSRSSRSDPRSG